MRPRVVLCIHIVLLWWSLVGCGARGADSRGAAAGGTDAAPCSFEGSGVGGLWRLHQPECIVTGQPLQLDAAAPDQPDVLQVTVAGAAATNVGSVVWSGFSNGSLVRFKDRGRHVGQQQLGATPVPCAMCSAAPTACIAMLSICVLSVLLLV